MFSLPINLQTLLLWSKTGNMLCQGIMRAGSFLSDCYQFLLTILFFLTVVTDMKLHNKEAVKCYLWKHIQSMRVLKTFVLLDIALFTGVTSFKCISVQLLTLSAVQTPPQRTGPRSATRACPWLQESPSPQWEDFSVWYVNQFFPLFYEKRMERKAAKATRGCRVLSG